MLFLFIKYRADAAVGILGVAAQVFNILLLFILVTDGDSAIRDCRLSGALGMAVITQTRQHHAAQITQQVRPDRATGAQATALMFRLEVSLVLDITETQCAGIQTVFALVGGAGNHRAIKLRMFTDGDIKTTFARKDTGLLLHRIIIAVQLVLTHAQVG
ncbi:Uncharacterised protein [Yersinia frederiksenii]|nr:Uncharacterised protein [Yersinia frederiksenii]